MVIPFHNSFINTDIKILSNQYTVFINNYSWLHKFFIPLYFIRQFFAMFIYVQKVKVIIIEFGGYWSLIPSIFGRLFKIPVLIILHGSDCASIPTINYGSLRKPLVKLSCKLSYQLAHTLLPVSESLIFTKNYYNNEYVNQGVRHHFPTIKTSSKVIHNGLDTNFWNYDQSIKKESNRFISVFSLDQFTLKGGDLILLIAREFPNLNFCIAGTSKPNYLNNIPENVIFLGKLSRKELREEFRRSTFHFQLS